MERKRDNENKIDPRLDTPSEANTEKHINFLAEEERSANTKDKNDDDLSRQRRKEWEDGIAEGKKSRETE